MSEPFLSELRIFSFNFPPKGWAFCNGQLLQINSNQALFALLGTTYGGDGRVTFGLPNLQGRIPMHMGSGFTLGQTGGEMAHTLTIQELPTHTHFLNAKNAAADTAAAALPPTGNIMAQAFAVQSGGGQVDVNLYSTGPADGNTMAPATMTNVGGSQPHDNTQPYLTLNICIALQGIFPSQN